MIGEDVDVSFWWILHEGLAITMERLSAWTDGMERFAGDHDNVFIDLKCYFKAKKRIDLLVGSLWSMILRLFCYYVMLLSTMHMGLLFAATADLKPDVKCPAPRNSISNLLAALSSIH